MCEDLCVLGLVEYKRCLYYENGKKVVEARWRGKPVILKSKLENFSSYEPLGILDYQVASVFCPPWGFWGFEMTDGFFLLPSRTRLRSCLLSTWCFTPLWR